jgi:uncharacterized protein YhjY with autotransporter beta-barrel domain
MIRIDSDSRGDERRGKMMSRNLMTVGRQKWFKSLIRMGEFALATLFLVVLASPAQTQTFDQAVANALGNGGGPACVNASGNLFNNICNPGGTPGASGGSTTTLSRESSPVEERKVQRLIGPLNLFFSGEYERFDKDVTKFEPGYKTNTGRATLGADYSFSDSFLVGGAFKYARDDGHFNAGGRFNTDSYGPLLHANFVPAPNSFIDAATGYARKNYFISRAVSFTQGGGTIISGAPAGNTDGNEFKVGVNGGYDFSFQSITIGPRLGLHYRHTEIDGYRERGVTGLELVYDSQRENSLTSVLGAYGSVAISTSFGVLVPQTTLEYVHEFQDPQRRITFRFAEDQARVPFRFQNDPPDRNYFNLGLGVVAVLPHGISPFLNYRALVGYNNESSYLVTAGVRIEF